MKIFGTKLVKFHFLVYEMGLNILKVLRWFGLVILSATLIEFLVSLFLGFAFELRVAQKLGILIFASAFVVILIQLYLALNKLAFMKTYCEQNELTEADLLVRDARYIHEEWLRSR